jgi:hypothetical protein
MRSVMYSSRQMGSRPTVTKYDLEGDLLGSFNVAKTGPFGIFGFVIALGPDGCTMYYGSWGGEAIGRFNVCTNTQEPLFNHAAFIDELRVLPNWGVLVTSDSRGVLYAESGQYVHTYWAPSEDNDRRTMALDADGTSFWMCCDIPGPRSTVGPLLRFDIASGELLDQWVPIERGPIAVYSPGNNGRGAG